MAKELWDCFYVNDELDLVELRFQLLDAVVDRFVVVEAALTFAGTSKPLHYSENRARFSQWDHRVDVVEARLPSDAPDAWDREYAQRATMRDHVRDAPGHVLLVVGDVDEIPDPDVLRDLKASDLSSSLRLGMKHANYYANWVMKTEWDLGPIAFTTAMLSEPPVAHLLGERALNDQSREGRRLNDAGWHLSFLGGPDRMRSKIRAYSHQDFATEANLRPGHLERCMRWGSAFTGYHVLRKQDLNELDAVQRFTLERRPEWFHFGQRSTFVRAHTYNAYCRRLLTGTLSPRLDRLLTRWPGAVTTWLLPYFLTLDTARRIRDRLPTRNNSSR